MSRALFPLAAGRSPTLPPFARVAVALGALVVASACSDSEAGGDGASGGAAGGQSGGASTGGASTGGSSTGGAGGGVLGGASGGVHQGGASATGGASAGPCEPSPCVHGACAEVAGAAACDCDPTWGGERCDEREPCDDLGATAPLSVIVSTDGATATYACSTGYALSGPATRSCEGGEWSGIAPACELVDCGEPPAADAHGARTFAGSTSAGAVASYACDVGREGGGTLTCGDDGEWDPAAPAACELVDCGAPPAVPDATVAAGPTVYDTVRTFTCDPGHTLSSGDGTIRCAETGLWSPAPTCTELPDGCDPNPCQHGGTCTESGGEFTGCIACDAGWSGQLCQAPFDCGTLTLTNGQVTYDPGTTLGGEAAHECNVGYELEGAPTRTCSASGWDGAAPSCSLVDCGAPPAPADGSVDASATTYGGTATYSCDPGYELEGTAVRTCGDDGAWSGDAPTCAIVDCGAPAAPDHGAVAAPATTYGETASYSCDGGYVLLGSSTRTCGETGSWSGSAPTCALDEGTCTLVYRFPTSGSTSKFRIDPGALGKATKDVGPGALVLRVDSSYAKVPRPGTVADPAVAEVLHYEMDQFFDTGVAGLAAVSTEMRICLTATDFGTLPDASLTGDFSAYGNAVPEQTSAPGCLGESNGVAVATLDFITESGHPALTNTCYEGLLPQDSSYVPSEADDLDASCLTTYLSYGRVKCTGSLCPANLKPTGTWINRTLKWSQGLLTIALSTDYLTLTMGNPGDTAAANWAQVPNLDQGWTGLALVGQLDVDDSTCVLP